MRWLVLGVSGNLGGHLREELAAQGQVVEALDRAQCDLEGPPAQLRQRLRDAMEALAAPATPLTVINAAAYTDVDGAEREEERAYLINAIGAEQVARAAAQRGARLCHLSTDFVFDGRSDRPYDEFDRPAPQGRYARSKYAGELLVREAAPDAAIVRVQGLYGRGGKNFVSTLAARLAAGQALRIDRQRRVTPTWSRALAQQLILLCQSGEPGLYHATCQGETTWFDFAQALVEEAAALGRALPRGFQGVDTADLTSPAPRPAFSVLENRMLRLRGLYTLPPWRDALRAYLRELCNHKLL